MCAHCNFKSRINGKVHSHSALMHELMTPQHITTDCNTLQHTATHCNTRVSTATCAHPTQLALPQPYAFMHELMHTHARCSTLPTLQHIATQRSHAHAREFERACTRTNTHTHGLPRTTPFGPFSSCNALQHTRTHCNIPQHAATKYNTLQHAATNTSKD